MKKAIALVAIGLSFLTPCFTESLSLIASIKNGGSLDDVKSQIAAGSDVNETDENGATPLMWATKVDDFGIVMYLIEKGAKPRLNGTIPAESGYYGNLLSVAAANGDVQILEYYINKVGLPVDDIEYNPTTKAKDGWTALIWACEKGKLDSVKFLLSKGANINFQAKGTSQTPLSVAAGFGKLDIVKYLIGQGANANFEYNGINALTYAERGGFQEVFDYLEDFVNTLYLRQKTIADYSDVELTIGNWDYGAAQFEDLAKDTKFIFTCTVANIGKQDNGYYLLVFTTKYNRFVDKHQDGPIYVEFGARPRANVGDLLMLSCRYAGLIKLRTDEGKTASLPRFVADKLRKRIQTMNY